MNDSNINTLITTIAGILTALITAISSTITQIKTKQFELETLRLKGELEKSGQQGKESLQTSLSPTLENPQTKNALHRIDWKPIILLTVAVTAVTVVVMATLTSLRPSTPNLLALETIQFDYDDSPTNHGWRIVEGDDTQLSIEKIVDSKIGNALKISAPATNFYAMDYPLNPVSSQFGNFIEIVSQFHDDWTSFYVYVSMTRDDGTFLDGWIKFKIGKKTSLLSPKPTDEQEWVLYVQPESFPSTNWVKIQIDLEKAVQETYGTDGWIFNKIIKFRVRGNISLDYITIYENER